MLISHVDAFTDRPFAGNPAAVLLCDEVPAEDWMRTIARETGLPATCFAWPLHNGFGIRWFKGDYEWPLCGHGTLAMAHVLFEERAHGPDTTARMHNHRAWELRVRREPDGALALDLPKPVLRPRPASEELVHGLGLQPVAIGRAGNFHIVELAGMTCGRDDDPVSWSYGSTRVSTNGTSMALRA